jgi:PAS domain S-box-containing protein
MKIPIQVLLVEDDEDDVLLTREFLSESETYRFDVEWEPRTDVAKQKMVDGKYDVFLIDYRLGSQSGLDLIKFANEKGVITPCILLTGQGDLRVDMDATKYGAADYLLKSDLNGSTLERSIRYALSHARTIRELDEKEKRYRSLFERSLDPIFLADHALGLVDVNEAFLRFFKMSKEEALASKVDTIFADQKDFEALGRTLRETEQIRDFESTLVTKGGEKRGCIINCVFIPDQTSEFCCYQGIIHDQTMRKKAERDMLIAERLSMTGKIARTVAHEVRNPLTSLSLALEQLKEEMPQDSDSLKIYTDVIQRNTNRIEQLIGEMLSSSRPKELNLELTDVQELVEDTVALSIDRINLNQMKIEKSYGETPRILLDKEKMKIAFLNIVVNAIEAMEAGRGLLRLETNRQNGFVMVSFSDNGKGIAPEDIEKLFDPFYTGRQGGMGLGLTSTKNILNSHSATIEVNSTVGEGTTFTVYFKLPES